MTRCGIYYCYSRIFPVILFQARGRTVPSYPFEDKHGRMTCFNLGNVIRIDVYHFQGKAFQRKRAIKCLSFPYHDNNVPDEG